MTRTVARLDHPASTICLQEGVPQLQGTNGVKSTWLLVKHWVGGKRRGLLRGGAQQVVKAVDGPVGHKVRGVLLLPTIRVGVRHRRRRQGRCGRANNQPRTQKRGQPRAT